MFDDVLPAADAWAESFVLGGLEATPTRHLLVLTCMDTRIDPLRIFGLAPGEAAVLRNAGARVDDAIRAALGVARDALDVERVLVMGHTDCRGTTDAFRTVREDLDAFDVERLTAGGFVYDVATGRVMPV